MNDQISTLPGNVSLDLDAYQRPPDEVKPPFRVTVGGKVITMKDPSDLDWRDLLAMTDPSQFLRLTMSPEDREHLNKTPIEGFKFNRLMEAFYRHFELEELADKARRESTLRSI